MLSRTRKEINGKSSQKEDASEALARTLLQASLPAVRKGLQPNAIFGFGLLLNASLLPSSRLQIDQVANKQTVWRAFFIYPCFEF